LIFPRSVTAREADKPEKLVFTTITIPVSNVSDSLLNEVYNIIQKHLKGEEFFIINEKYTLSDDITFNNCIKKQCVRQLAGVTPDGVIVIISITSEEVKIGEKRLTRYMVEDLIEKRYILHIVSADLLKEKYDLEFTETFNNNSKLLNEADLIGGKIREYYMKRKPEIKPACLYNTTGVSLNISMIYPSGSFGNIADYGYGIDTVLNGFSPLLPAITINPGISFYSLESSESNINSAYMFLPEISFGYIFTLTKKITLSPVFGLGYSFMFIDGITDTDSGNSGTDFYYNPEFKVGIETSFILTENYSLLFDASYSCIAERSSILYFSSFNLGIRMNLE